MTMIEFIISLKKDLVALNKQQELAKDIARRRDTMPESVPPTKRSV